MVPVDDLVALDEAIRRCRSRLEHSNEWFSHVELGVLRVGSQSYEALDDLRATYCAAWVGFMGTRNGGDTQKLAYR